MFGINKIKKRLEWVENELEYYKRVESRKEENKKRRKDCQLMIPIINKNDGRSTMPRYENSPPPPRPIKDSRHFVGHRNPPPPPPPRIFRNEKQIKTCSCGSGETNFHKDVGCRYCC